jgi:hypothetical protein
VAGEAVTVPGHLDPGDAAYYALICVCLVALGALLTGDLETFTVAERGTLLGGIVAVLGYVGWRWKRQHRDED